MALKFRNKPIPVKLDDELAKRIEVVAQKMGEPKSTVMRIAMRIGLEGLDKVFQGAPGIAAISRQYGEHQPDNLALNEESSSSAKTKKTAADVLEGEAKHLRDLSPKDRGDRKK